MSELPWYLELKAYHNGIEEARKTAQYCEEHGLPDGIERAEHRIEWYKKQIRELEEWHGQ